MRQDVRASIKEACHDKRDQAGTRRRWFSRLEGLDDHYDNDDHHLDDNDHHDHHHDGHGRERDSVDQEPARRWLSMTAAIRG